MIGGTIPWSGVSQTLAYLNKLPEPAFVPAHKRWLQITLSLPPGLAPSAKDWAHILQVCFDGMGWSSRSALWIGFTHPEKTFNGLVVNHAHFTAEAAALSGMAFPTSNLKKRCDDAEAAIKHHLGISFVPSSPLTLNLPQRH